MRPITLTMQAFGSYGRKTEIDFTKANRNLFLITGQIITGLCYTAGNILVVSQVTSDFFQIFIFSRIPAVKCIRFRGNLLSDGNVIIRTIADSTCFNKKNNTHLYK